MSLASKLHFQFDRAVRERGVRLFDARLVQVDEASPDSLIGHVMGGNAYHISLEYVDGSLLADCECPYFDEHGHCKHLWAAVLEADRLGALRDASQRVHVDLEAGLHQRPSVSYPGKPNSPGNPPVPEWQESLALIGRSLERQKPGRTEWPQGFEIRYVIDLAASKTCGTIVLDLFSRSRKKNGEWTVYKELHVTAERASSLPDPVDAEVMVALFGAQDFYSYQYSMSNTPSHRAIPPLLALTLLPRIAEAGRLAQRSSVAYTDFKPLDWDAGEPWKPWLEVRQDERDQWNITGLLRRGEERMPLDEPALILASGFVIAHGKVAQFDAGGAFAWVTQLRDVKRIPFPDRQRDAVMSKLLETAVVPPMEVDEALQFEERSIAPRFGLRVTQHRGWGEDEFRADVLCDYGRGWMDGTDRSRGIWLPEERIYIPRDHAAEDAARETLKGLGMKSGTMGEPFLRLSGKALPRVVRELLQAGWHVEAEGKSFRRPGGSKVEVTSGIDWFELHAEVDYGGATAKLPDLLAALRRGDTMVKLGDGSYGLLPEDWLERFAPLAGLGSKEEDHLRFRSNQAGLLDALLAAQPEVRVDEAFERARQRLRDFQGISPAPQPGGFVGTLRDYQREGVGWIHFLREFGFGGCLADDMGVGKTAQVLAVLEQRRAEGRGPALVVAPKSLMFNWREEAARFTPQIRVLEHTGAARDTTLIGEHDLVLTTYGTMLRDVARLSEMDFDYIVLDEAQAIKNASTASAKAVRLLRGEHRLVLSGTPVENHLGELWSLFEFLNPGMLGEAKVLQMAGGLARNPSDEARKLLGTALRPFILRRTKQQVARELPEKTEQTIYCELEGPQRKQYDELRTHYRESLLQRVAAEGMGRAKMHVLEALLRLRQAACHPGLLDKKRADEPSAKLDVLIDQLEELREEGHKALVFSQFTGLLAIVRARLDAAGVRYAYLDGSTRDREAKVNEFQNDPQCELFLISLKAGGTGLNLTAAEYVFLLDPWWNPAVEAQAVDRAHRIGQTRPVFAYRLIARNTVEEKVLELQKSKRDLADAILNQDNSLIRGLKKEDLELLLS